MVLCPPVVYLVVNGKVDTAIFLALSIAIGFGIWQRPIIGIFLIAFVAHLDQLQKFFGGILSVVKVIVFVTAIAFFVSLAIKKQKVKFTTPDLPILLFALSWVSSVNKMDSSMDFIIWIAQVIGYWILYFLCVNLVNNKDLLLKLIYTLLIASMLISIYAILQYSEGKAFLFQGQYATLYSSTRGNEAYRIKGLSYNSNAAGYSYILGIPIFIGLYFFEKNRMRRILIFMTIALGSICLFLTQSRGGIFGLIGGIIVIVLLSVKKKRYLRLIFTIFLFGAVIVNFVPSSVMSGVWLFNDISTENRFAMIPPVISMFLAHPFFGVGFNQTPKHITQYGYHSHSSPHNNLFLVALEAGLLGLIPYICFNIAYIRILFKSYKKSENKALSWLIIGFLSSFVAFNINGLSHDNIFDRLVWLTVGMGVALTKIVNREILPEKESMAVFDQESRK